MKALSLKQPYAELILQGKKTIELRKWNTHFRGTFFIHASRIPDREAMKKFKFSDLPLGSIVGQATLKEVKHYKTSEEHDQDKDKHLASEQWGSYGFMLENVKRIPLIPCKGKLNFFTVDLK
jgi:predicted transcriptional regulator